MNPPRRPRGRALLRVMVRVPGCLALVCGLLLCGAGTSSAGTAWGDLTPPSPLPLPPGGDRSGTAVMAGRVFPAEAVVEPEANGDFTLSVTNTGAVPAYDLRVLLDDAKEGNGVGSADGRCLSRLDASSPADLWCELGDVAPRQTVSVSVHTYMASCAEAGQGAGQGAGQAASAPGPSPAPAFHWRIAYTDAGRVRTINGPAPQWSCSPPAAQGL